MDKNKKLINMLPRWVYGLSWLCFPFGIVVLAIEHEKMNKEEKQYMVSIFVVAAIEVIISTISGIMQPFFSNTETAKYVVAAIFGVLEGTVGLVMLIAAILCMCENFWKVPLAYSIAGNFVNDEPAKKDDVIDAEITEEPKDK